MSVPVENLKKHTKRGEVKIGPAPPGYIVFAASDFRLPLFLPEQAKAYETFRIARFFTRFGSFRGKRKAPERHPDASAFVLFILRRYCRDPRPMNFAFFHTKGATGLLLTSPQRSDPGPPAGCQ